MTDYGAERGNGPRRQKWKTIIAIAAFVVITLGAVAITNVISKHNIIAASTADVQADNIVGLPCRPGTPHGELGRGDAWMMFQFNDAQYGRRIGHVDCAISADKASQSGFKGVCQFSSPAEIKVVPKNAPPVYFETGLGVAATTIVSDAGVTCIMAGSFQ